MTVVSNFGTSNRYTIRSAVAPTRRPFLMEEASDLLNQANIILAKDAITEKDLERAMNNSRQCCLFFPSFESFTCLGQSQYLSGQLPEALVSLKEAFRLQKISYRHPDLHPLIEGYLALVYLKTGDLPAGEKMMNLFETKYEEDGWSEDTDVRKLKNELVEVHQQTASTKTAD